MIDKDTYKEILDNGLIIDHYFLLCNIHNNVPLPDSKRIQGFINLLTKKGYITENGVVSLDGLALIKNCKFAEELQLKDVKVDDFSSWVGSIHTKCQDRIFELTGKKQVMDKVTGGNKSYPFLPNAMDLGKTLAKFMLLYKQKDRKKIEHAMLNHIEKCSAAKSWFPLMGYYIMKNGQSQLATEIDSIDNFKQDENMQVRSTRVDPKSLF